MQQQNPELNIPATEWSVSKSRAEKSAGSTRSGNKSEAFLPAMSLRVVVAVLLSAGCLQSNAALNNGA